MKLYYFLLMMFLIGCGENGKGQLPEKNTPTTNNVYVSDFKDSAYKVVKGGRIIISPTITRDISDTNEELKFEWRIGKIIISNEQNLDIDLPDSVTDGIVAGCYVVTDVLRNKRYVTSFTIEVCDVSGYGYYFLSVDHQDNSLLSYLPTDFQEVEELFHRTKIGNLLIGKKANSLNSRAVYDFQEECIQYNLYLTSELGENPHIVTDNRSLIPIRSLSNSQNGEQFSPNVHLLGQRENRSYFLNNGSCRTYNGEILEKGNQNKNFAFNYLIVSSNDQMFYAFDKNTRRFYQIRNDGSGQTIAIENSSLLEEEILLSNSTKMEYQNGVLVEEINILTSSATEVHHYKIRNDGVPAMWLFHSFQTNERANVALFTDSGICYIAAGRSILEYTPSSKNVSQFKRLDPLFGLVTSLASDQERLIATTYDSNSILSLKGSIQFIDFQTRETSYFYNSLHRCLGIVCCTKKSW